MGKKIEARDAQVRPKEPVYSEDPEVQEAIRKIHSYKGESGLYEIPENEGTELESPIFYEYLDEGRVWDRYFIGYDPRETFPVGRQGDAQFEAFVAYREEHNRALRTYLESQGWQPELDGVYFEQ